MLTDAEIADLFDRAAADLEPAIGAIIGRAERQGRRMRTRRRTYLAAGNVLAVGAIAVASAVIGTAGGPATGPASAGAAGISASAGAGPHAPRSPGIHHRLRHGLRHPKAIRSGVAVRGPMTRRQIIAMLRTMLPASSTISHVQRGIVGESVEFDYNDGKGAVDFILAIQPASMSKAHLACPRPPWNGDEGPRPAGALPISCVMRTLADGSTERDWVTGADVKSFYGYNIWLIRRDGVAVFLQVGNGINHILPQVDRAVPPGSMAEWIKLVESPAWHL
jgi:hypothetical protein